MATTTEIDLTIKDIADRINMTPRTVNLWRASAEQRLGHSLGYKIGKVTYFKADEVREILKSRDAGNNGNSQNFGERDHFSQHNNQAESEVIGGLDALVASGDQNAAMVGRAIGQRWNQIVVASALAEMQTGMMQMQSSFAELQASIEVTANTLPQLPGMSPLAPQLEASDE